MSVWTSVGIFSDLHLDFGDTDLNSWIGNLTGIAFVGAGIVESCHATSVGRSLKIQTDLGREETRVFLEAQD